MLAEKSLTAEAALVKKKQEVAVLGSRGFGCRATLAGWHKKYK